MDEAKVINISDIWKFELTKGNSKHPREGSCILDAVSWFEYGILGDHPPCVCPVLAAYGRKINDTLSDSKRQDLKKFIPRLIGTVDPSSEQARAEYLAWQAVRVFAPIALDRAGLFEQANILRTFSGDLTMAATRAATRAAAWAAEAAWATEADRAVVEDMMIAALDGALRIGRQAEPLLPEKIIIANQSFADAEAL